MKDSKSSDIQSPLNDQEKGVGFILVKNAVMKNTKGNFQSPGKEKAASRSDGSNFFIFLGILGIAIFLNLVIQVPEIIAELNSKQEEFGASQKQITARMDQAKSFYNDPSLIAPGLRRATDPSINRVERWKQHLAKNPLVLKKFVPDNDSQLLSQNNDSQLLNQIKIIQQQLEDQENTLDFLDIQARARRNMIIGQTILRLNQAGAFNFLN